MNGGADELDRWIFRPSPHGTAWLRVICVPYAGGSVVAYHGWAELLPDYAELWVLRLPGREARVREPLSTDLVALAGRAAEVCASRLDTPYVLFGHSLGAWIAFEMAKALRDRVVGPALLAVSGRSAPHEPLRYPPIHDLPADDFLAALHRRFNAIPPAIRDDATVRDFYLPILRADTAMLETYAHRAAPALTSPIAAFGGRADPEVTEANLAAWGEHTSAGSTVTMFPGDHFYLQAERAPLVRALVDRVSRVLVP